MRCADFRGFQPFILNHTIGSECNAVITQGLFNDDDKYEFLLPELAVFETTQENWNGTLVTTTYTHKPIGYKIISEDGATLHSLILNAEKDPDMRCYASVTSIGKWAFYNCHKFTKVVLPETLTELGSMTFAYCDNLTEIYLPASLEKVEIGTFGQKENKIDVYVKKGSPAISAYTDFDVGIATQTILLAAAEKGISGCIIGSHNTENILREFGLDDDIDIRLCIALGKAAENIILEDTIDGGLRYYRDAENNHHVPKRKLSDIVIEIK